VFFVDSLKALLPDSFDIAESGSEWVLTGRRRSFRLQRSGSELGMEKLFRLIETTTAKLRGGMPLGVCGIGMHAAPAS